MVDRWSYIQIFWNNSKKLVHPSSTSLPCFTGPERVTARASLIFYGCQQAAGFLPGMLCALLCMRVMSESYSVRLLLSRNSGISIGDPHALTGFLFYLLLMVGKEDKSENSKQSGYFFSIQYSFNTGVRHLLFLVLRMLQRTQINMIPCSPTGVEREIK